MKKLIATYEGPKDTMLEDLMLLEVNDVLADYGILSYLNGSKHRHHHNTLVWAISVELEDSEDIISALDKTFLDVNFHLE